MRSRIDYIFGYDRQIIQNVAVRDPRHNSNHFVLMGCLCGASPRKNLRYLGRWMRLLLRLPGRQTRMWADKIFAKLRSAIPKPDKQAVRHNLWILEDTYRLIDKIVSARREPGRCPGEVVTGDSGRTEGGQATEDVDIGQRHGTDPDR